MNIIRCLNCSFSANRSKTALRLIWLASLLWIGIIGGASPASSEEHILSANAHVKGNFSLLLEHLKPLSNLECHYAGCATELPALPLTITTPNHPGGVAVTLLRAKTSNAISPTQPYTELPNTRPILLRGKMRLRHAGDNNSAITLPITATVFRDSTPPLLELSLPFSSSRRRATTNLSLVQVPLDPGTIAYGDFNARFARTPLAAVAEKICGVTQGISSHSAAANAPKFAASTSATPRNTFTGKAASYRVIHLGTDYDSSFYAAQKCKSTSECNNKIISIINHAAIFYENQLGMTLEVEQQFGPTPHSNSTDSGDLLFDFVDYNNSYRSNFFDDGENTGAGLVDIFALFTGRTLDESVIGLAYVATACKDSDAAYAGMLVQHVSRSLNPVVAAHEAGHSFNAAHTTSGIMSAALGSPPPTVFSSTSVREITDHIDSYYGDCNQATSAGIPNRLGFTAEKTTTGEFVLSVTTPSLQPSSCFISIRAAETAASTYRGKTIKRFVPATTKSRFTGRISQRILSSSTAGANVYLRAFYSCSDSYMVARSGVRTINPNSGTILTSRQVPRTSWITLLDSAFP